MIPAISKMEEAGDAFTEIGMAPLDQVEGGPHEHAIAQGVDEDVRYREVDDRAAGQDVLAHDRPDAELVLGLVDARDVVEGDLRLLLAVALGAAPP